MPASVPWPAVAAGPLRIEDKPIVTVFEAAPPPEPLADDVLELPHAAADRPAIDISADIFTIVDLDFIISLPLDGDSLLGPRWGMRDAVEPSGHVNERWTRISETSPRKRYERSPVIPPTVTGTLFERRWHPIFRKHRRKIEYRLLARPSQHTRVLDPKSCRSSRSDTGTGFSEQGVTEMWAQQLIAPERFAEVDAPPPRDADLAEGDVLLRVLAGGICGSDLPAFKGLITPYLDARAPGALGIPGFPLHEVVGEVLASRHPDHTPGSRVVGWDTGFTALAELTVTRGSDLATFSPVLRPEVAVMLQPLACVLYAVAQIPRVADRRVAVLGQGPIGLLFSHALKTAGASFVVGVDRVERADEAATFGVDEAVLSYTDRWSRNLNDQERPEIIIEAIGHQVATLGHAIDAVAEGGLIYYFGVPDDPVYPVSMASLFRKNLTLVSGITAQRHRWLVEANAYLARFPELARSYVTHVLPAKRAQEAFELAVSPSAHRLKVSLVMQ